MQAACVNEFKLLAPELLPEFHSLCNCFSGGRSNLKITCWRSLGKRSFCTGSVEMGYSGCNEGFTCAGKVSYDFTAYELHEFYLGVLSKPHPLPKTLEKKILQRPKTGVSFYSLFSHFQG